MGMSVDGALTYGVYIGAQEDGLCKPFGDMDDFELDEWWLEVNNYKPHMEVWTSDGEYPDPKPPESEYKRYRDDRQAMMNTLPFEITWCGHMDYPGYIINFKDGYQHTVEYSDATPINPSDLMVSKEHTQLLIQFCTEYGIVDDDGEPLVPGWFLTCCYG